MNKGNTFLQLIALIAFATAPLESAAEKVTMHEPYMKKLAAMDVLSGNCLELNSYGADYSNYRVAAGKLMSVSEINTEIYDKAYSTIYRNTQMEPQDSRIKDCATYRQAIIAETNEINEDYRIAVQHLDDVQRMKAEAWAEALALTASALQGLQQGMRAATPQFGLYIPMPSGKVDFGQGISRKNGYSHYLISTPAGQKTCHVASSGYIFCN